MMKYKVGDKVRIRHDLSESIEWVNKAMLPYAGKLATIIRVNHKNGFYDVDIDNKRWTWYDSMLEDADTERHKMNKRVVIEVEGDEIVARCGDKKGIVRYHPDKEFYLGAKIALERLKETDKPYRWLKKGMRFYMPDIFTEELYEWFTYDADKWDKRAIERGIVFQTKEEAVRCARKMLAAVKQEG